MSCNLEKQQNKKQIGDFIRRSDCRFCKSQDMVKILDFGNVPLAGGFLKECDFAEEKFFPLDLNFCNNCSLVQVSNVVSAETMFKNYFYFSSSIKKYKTLVTRNYPSCFANYIHPKKQNKISVFYG